MKNEQIEVIMTNEGMNAAQLAERIGIQRAQISHLLTNRNKASLDIVKRIHRAFPYISYDWLMDQQGDYYIEGMKPEAPQEVVENAAPSASAIPSNGMGQLFDLEVTQAAEPAPSPVNTNVPASTPKNVAASNVSSMAQSNAFSPATDKATGDARNAVESKNATINASEPDFCSHEAPKDVKMEPIVRDVQIVEHIVKEVRNVIEIKIFYDDGTYETFCKK